MSNNMDYKAYGDFINATSDACNTVHDDEYERLAEPTLLWKPSLPKLPGAHMKGVLFFCPEGRCHMPKRNGRTFQVPIRETFRPGYQQIVCAVKPECKGCLYTRHGLTCWSADGSCLKTDMDKTQRRNSPCSD